MRKTKRSGDRKTMRKSEKRRLKKTRRAYRKSPQKGGFEYGMSGINYANEGIVIYPSIIPKSDILPEDSITKIYYRAKYYDIEIQKYRIFDLVDSEHRYHCNVYSHGNNLIPTHYLSNELKQNIQKIDFEKQYAYIDMEYVGETIGSPNTNTSNPKLRKAILEFFIKVLQLQNDEGYLVHGDPHAGNICYKIDTNGEYIIKYIDITQLELVPGNQIITSGNDSYNIRAQFSSLIGTIRHIFGYDNPIANELTNIKRVGNTYESVLHEVLEVLIKYNI